MFDDTRLDGSTVAPPSDGSCQIVPISLGSECGRLEYRSLYCAAVFFPRYNLPLNFLARFVRWLSGFWNIVVPCPSNHGGPSSRTDIVSPFDPCDKWSFFAVLDVGQKSFKAHIVLLYLGCSKGTDSKFAHILAEVKPTRAIAFVIDGAIEFGVCLVLDLSKVLKVVRMYPISPVLILHVHVFSLFHILILHYISALVNPNLEFFQGFFRVPYSGS